jgi:hypothetical protein
MIHAFLREGAEQMDDQVYDAVRADIDQRRQRVVIGPWRVPTLNKLVPIGLGAAAVVGVLLVGSQLLGSPTSDVGGPAVVPTPTPQPSGAAPSAEPTSAADGSLPEGPYLIADPAVSLETRPITVTIPSSGWTGDPELAAVGKGEDVSNVPEATLLAWTPETPLNVYGNPCQWATTITPATTAAEISAALAAPPSREATAPEDVTVGGSTGKHVTLHVPTDIDLADCTDGKFVSYGHGGDPLGRYHQGPGQIDELWILDVGGGIVILDAMYRADTPTDTLEELRAIAESATFE